MVQGGGPERNEGGSNRRRVKEEGRRERDRETAGGEDGQGVEEMRKEGRKEGRGGGRAERKRREEGRKEWEEGNGREVGRDCHGK